jgi:ribonuclease P protein component
MLRKKERLSREAFNRFFSVGKRYHSPSLQLIYSPHDTFHASVVVSKKVARSAVKRNKIRRRIYDIVRNYKQSNNETGVFIIITKPNVATYSYAVLKEEVLGLISSIYN